MDEHESESYAYDVLNRFRNPFIRHELISIMLNCVSKWRVRVLPSMLDYLKENTMLPGMLTFSLAAIIRFYDGEIVSPTELRGHWNGKSYPIFDDAPVLAFFHEQWSIHCVDGNIDRLVDAVLANESLWGRDLREVIDMVYLTTQNLISIEKDDIIDSLNHLS